MAQLKETLDNRPDLQKYLFIRGFLVTSGKPADMNAYPFYGNWRCDQFGKYSFMTHRDMPALHWVTAGSVTFFLLGHSYNPFTLEYEEKPQLQRIADAYGSADFQACIDELTGVFVLGWVDEDRISFVADPSGMQSAYCGVVGRDFALTSHPQLIGDLYGLQMDPLAEELIHYKWYPNIPGPFLPADLSPFAELKRVVPNNLFTYDGDRIAHKRFCLIGPSEPDFSEQTYRKTIDKAAEILKNNMLLISKKWQNPAISLTGGIDSNTTFAAANGLYDKFETFSYLSAHKESIDVEAAQLIADRFHTKHTVYEIPQENDNLPDFEIKHAILTHNSSYMAPRKENEVRKRIYLDKHCPYDVEVKSWVSETFRAPYHHRYRRKRLPGLSPKLFRNLYKIFITDRRLAHKVDTVYRDYIERFEYADIQKKFHIADIHFWEVVWSSWGGVNVSEMKSKFDITVPYNNRILIYDLLSVEFSKRSGDIHHLDIKRQLNQELYDMNIHVVNMKETYLRGFLLNIFFTTNMILPF